jgi:hypothetical protein
VQLIEEQQEAVGKLPESAKGYTAIFAIERGGAALAEQIASGGMLVCLTKKIQESKSGIDNARKKNQEVSSLIADIEEYASSYDKSEPVFVTVAETFVGGGSLSDLVGQIASSGILGKFPNLKIRFYYCNSQYILRGAKMREKIKLKMRKVFQKMSQERIMKREI